MHDVLVFLVVPILLRHLEFSLSLTFRAGAIRRSELARPPPAQQVTLLLYLTRVISSGVLKLQLVVFVNSYLVTQYLCTICK